MMYYEFVAGVTFLGMKRKDLHVIYIQRGTFAMPSLRL